MKSYTDLEQSKKLAEILPIESADMVYIDAGYCSRALPSNDIDANSYPTMCPCWSLAALLNVLDYAKCDIHKDIYGWKCYIQPNDFRYDSKWKDNPVDACVEVICERNDRLDELRRKYCDYDT